MGNSLVNTLFKEYRKKGAYDDNKIYISPEVLLYQSDEFIRPLLRNLLETMRSDEELTKALMPENVQTNNYGEDSVEYFAAQKALLTFNDLMACGYKNPEAVLEDLRNPSYTQFFTVVEDDKKKTGHEANLARATFLLALHTIRQQKSSDKINFKDYLRKLMTQSSEDDEQTNTAITTSLGLVVTMMKELKGVTGYMNLLVKTLEHIALTLKRIEPGALFKTHTRTGFILDASLNDTRAFLVNLLKTQGNLPQDVVKLALKVLLSLAVVRNSIEDVLIVCSLLSDTKVVKGEVDLREEIMLLKNAMEHPAAEEHEDFDPSMPFDCYDDVKNKLLGLPDKQEFSPDNSSYPTWVVDGEFVYAYSNYDDKAILSKFSLGTSSTLPGSLVTTRKLEGEYESGTLLLMGDKLYLRHKPEGDAKNPWSIVDKDFLNVTKLTEDYMKENFPEPAEGEEDKEQEPSIKWKKDDGEGGRTLAYTPMFTDGNYLYTISRVIATSKEEEDAGDSLPTKFQCEIYDPKNNFKFVRAISLYKNAQKEHLVKESNTEDFLKRTRWATNGEYLMMFAAKGKMRFISLKTGIVVSKKQWLRNCDYNNIYYCPNQNKFFFFWKDDYNITTYRTWSLSEVSKAHITANASSPFETINKALFKKSEQAKPALSIIDQLMRGQVTSDVASQETQMFQPMTKNMAHPRLQRALIIHALASNMTEFWNDADLALVGDSKLKLKMFRYPLKTYLTNVTFTELQSGLELLAATKGDFNDDTHQQVAYDFLQIVNANFRALMICNIHLNDLFYTEDSLKAFQKAYDISVATFAKDESIPEKVRKICSIINGNAISLIYDKNEDVLTKLVSCDPTSVCEKEYLLIEFVSQPIRFRQLLAGSKDSRDKILNLFKKVSWYLGFEQKKKIGVFEIGKEPDVHHTDRNVLNIISSFLTTASFELIAHYTTLVDQVVKLRKAKQKDALREKKAELSAIGQYLVGLVNSTADQIKAVYQFTVEQIKTYAEELKTDDDDIPGKYSTYSNQISSCFREYGALEQIFSSFVICLNLTNHMEKDLLKAITDRATDLIFSLSNWYTVRDKHAEKLGIEVLNDPYDPEQILPDRFEKLVLRFRSLLSWHIGAHAQNLLKIPLKAQEDKEKKEDEPEKEKKKKEKKLATEKVAQSNLLSGGLDLTYAVNLSEETLDQILKYATCIDDKDLLSKVTSPAQDPEQQYLPLIKEGLNEDIDSLIKLMQKKLSAPQMRAKYPFITLGGPDGMRLSRAAFAVIIKYSDSYEEFEDLMDNMELDKDDTSILDDSPEILKKWEQASRMRSWINQKKLKLVELRKEEIQKKKADDKHEAYLKDKEERDKAEEEKKKAEEEKQKQKEKEEKLAKEKAEQEGEAEEKKDEEKPKEEEEPQIDTSSKAETKEEDKKEEEKKEGEEKKEEMSEEDKENASKRLTHEEMTAAEDEAYDKALEDLAEAFNHIVDKAIFLCKLNTPKRFQKSKGSKKVSNLVMNKTMSNIQETNNGRLKFENKMGVNYSNDWESRLKRWKDYQLSEGTVQSENERQQKIWASGVSSILALLQTEIKFAQLQEHVEKITLDGAKRIAGLKLISKLTEGEMPESELREAIGWFTSSMRRGKNNLCHYLDDVQGQGVVLEKQAQDIFFEILGNLVGKLQSCKDDFIRIILIDALKWKFISRDHEYLAKINLFAVLHRGSGAFDDPIKQSWGKSGGKMIYDPKDQKLQDATLEMFEMLFMMATARLADTDMGDNLEIKKSAKNTPALSLQRAKSVLNEPASEILLSQGFDVVMREIMRYNDLLEMLQGIDWESFARRRNEDRRNDQNLIALNQEEQKKIYDLMEKDDFGGSEGGESEQEEMDEAKDEEKKENDDEKKEEEDKQIEEGSEPVKTEEIKLEELTEEQKEEAEQKKKEEEEKKQEEDREKWKKFDEKIYKDIGKLQDREIKLVKSLYQEANLIRLLRLLETFTAVALTSDHPLALMQKIANPLALSQLVTLLMGASPRVKCIVIKIMDNLITMKIPLEVFSESITLATQDKRSLAYKILNMKTKAKLDGNAFLKFIFNYLLTVRSYLWSNRDIDSEGQYCVTQIMTSMLRVLQSIKGGAERQEWAEELRKEVLNALNDIDSLSLSELDTVFCLLPGGEFEGVSAGDAALTHNDETVIVLGYSDKWKQNAKNAFQKCDDGEQYERRLRNLNLTQEFENDSQMVVCLFYDKNQKARQDIILVSPSNLSVKTNVDNDEALAHHANSPLMVEAVVKKLIEKFIASTKDESQRSTQVQALILKVLDSQMATQGQQYLDFIGKIDGGKLLDNFIISLRSGIRDPNEVLTSIDETEVLPQKWLEAKVQKLRKYALETNQTIEMQEQFCHEQITTMLAEGKDDLLVKRMDPRTKDVHLTNVMLTATINANRVEEGIPLVSTTRSQFQVGSTGQALKDGLVSMSFKEFDSLDERTLEIAKHSQAIMIGHAPSDDIRAAYQKLFKLAREDYKKANTEQKGLINIVDTAFFFVLEDEMPDLTQKTNWKEFHDLVEGEVKTPLERFLFLLSKWGGIKYEQALLHIDPKNVENLAEVTTQLHEGLVESYEADEKLRKALKAAEANKKDKKELTKLQEEMKAKVARELTTIMEKKTQIDKIKADEKLKKQGTLIEKVQLESYEEFQTDKELMEEYEEIGEKQIGKKVDSAPNKNKEKEADESSRNKLLFSLLQDIGQPTCNLAVEHHKAMGQILAMQKKKLYLDILQMTPVEKIIPEDADHQRLLISFLKVQFNQAVLKRAQIGQKTELTKVKTLIKRILENGNKKFIENLFFNGAIKAGINGVKQCKKQNKTSISEFFNSEENSVRGCNPYMIKFLCSYAMKNIDNELFKSIVLRPAGLSNVFSIFLCFAFLFQKDNVVPKLLKHCLKIIQFLREHEDVTIANGELEKIAKNKLVKAATKYTKWKTDGDSEVKYLTSQQLIFLEIHLAISQMCDQISSKHGIVLGKVVEDSEQICEVKKIKQVLQESKGFQLLKYLNHFEQLTEKEQGYLNLNVQTTNPTLKALTRAHVSIPEVQKVNIKVGENCLKLSKFEFLGISNNEDGSEMKTYSSGEQEISWMSNDFYIFHPVQKRQVICFGHPPYGAFAENTQDGDTIYKSMNAPEKCKDWKPKRVWCKNDYTVVENSDGNFYECGRMTNVISEYYFKDFGLKAEKIKSIHLAFNFVMAHMKDGSVKVKGENYDCVLPKDQSASSWTDVTFHKDDDKKKQTIVHCNAARIISSYVNDEGKLFVQGYTYLNKIESYKEDMYGIAQEIKIPEKTKCLRAWCVSANDGYEDFAVYVELEDEQGQISYHSNGLVLIGQKDAEESTSFKPIDFPANLKIKEFKTYDKKIIIQDEKDELWGWGKLDNKEFGINDIPEKGFKVPKKLESLNKLGKILDFSVVQTHTILKVQDKDGDIKMYCIGEPNDANIEHFGYKKKSDITSGNLIHELSDFNERSIADFACGTYATLIILEGPKGNFTDELYQHGTTAETKGLQHFISDKEGKAGKVYNNDDVAELGDHLSLTIKCPISAEEMKDKVWPSCTELESTHVDLKAKPEQIEEESKTMAIKHGVKDTITGKDITGVRYYTRYTCNDAEVEINLSEESIQQDNQYTISPLVFYRLTKPLLPEQKLPLIDLKQYYDTRPDTLVDLEIQPDLKMLINSELIKKTQSKWDEANQVFDKLDQEKHYEEFMKIMNDKMKQKINDCYGNFSEDIDFEDTFKLADCEFKSQKLIDLPDKVKMLHAKLIWKLNCFYQDSIIYNSNDLMKIQGSLSQVIRSNKMMVLPSITSKIVQKQIEALPTGSRTDLKLKRNPAKEFADSGQCDHTGQFTIFGQILQRTKADSSLINSFRMNSVDDQAFNVVLAGEGSIDVGGPFREMLTNVANEVESTALPLLVKTPNNRNEHGSNRECFTLNASSTSPTHAELFKLLGYFIGYAARSKSAMDFNFPPLFWKRLVGADLTMNDLKGVDKFSFQVLEETKENMSNYPPDVFDSVIAETFTVIGTNQQVIELCEGGSEKNVNHANCLEFIDLATKTLLNEGERQLAWVKEGIEEIIPMSIIDNFSWIELENRVCGNKEITVEALKEITDNGDSDHQIMKWFWEMFEGFTQDERKSYLKYVWGRSKIPTDCSNLRYRHRVDICDGHMEKNGFPIAHTCFFSVDVPGYDSLEVMSEKFKYAMEACGEIDGDYGPEGVRPEDSD